MFSYEIRIIVGRGESFFTDPYVNRNIKKSLIDKKLNIDHDVTGN